MSPAQQPCVLVVEDESAQREVLQYNLEAEGFRVAMAVNGDEALLMVREEKPDLIVLDWMLPNVSGIEICRRIKADPATASVPGILLTVLFFIVIACMGLIYNYPRSEKKTLRERARTIALASPTLLIPIVIVGSILAGIANPTESAAVGAVVSKLTVRVAVAEPGLPAASKVSTLASMLLSARRSEVLTSVLYVSVPPVFTTVVV